jgi:hypothetical protein
MNSFIKKLPKRVINYVTKINEPENINPIAHIELLI